MPAQDETAYERWFSLNQKTSPGDTRPFKIDVSQRDLDDLRDRLHRTRWTAEQPRGATNLPGISAGAEYGFPLARLRRLVRYWLDEFDWRRWEARINAYPQFITEIDGQPIHFLHVCSEKPDAVPLILTHGWPGSILEYLDVIDLLTDPGRRGSDAGPAFHVVLPSLPGFGFSGPARESGWGTRRTAAAWAQLMRHLGYRRYGAVGNDAGSMISPEIGRIAAEQVIGVHVTQLFSFPSGAAGEVSHLTADEEAALGVLSWFWAQKGAFNTLHSQQPQTLAHAISDSPAGLLAWNGQLFDDSLDDDFVVANTALYWLTGTAGSSIRFYFEDAHNRADAIPTTVPTALAAAESGDFKSIRRFAERDHHNIVAWHTLPGVSGHYAAHTHPAELATDIAGFFAQVS